MGPTQIKCYKTFPAPSEFPVLSPGGSYQMFRARLVWINDKSLTLMLPTGKENRKFVILNAVNEKIFRFHSLTSNFIVLSNSQTIS